MPRKNKSMEELSAAEAAMGVQEPGFSKKAATRRRSSASSAGETESAAPRKPRARKTSPAVETASAQEDAGVAAPPVPQETNESILSQGVSLHEQIALLAYSYWQERGYQGGSPEDDWFRAEQEIQGRFLNGEIRH